MPRITRRRLSHSPPPRTSGSWPATSQNGTPRSASTPTGPKLRPTVAATIVSRDDEAMTLSYHIPDPPFLNRAPSLHDPRRGRRPLLLRTSHGRPTSPPSPRCCRSSKDSIGDDVFSKALDNLATYAQDEYGRQQVSHAG